MWTRAPRVDAGGRAEVLPEVEKHVHHARSHLPRRRERPDVVPIANDPPLAAAERAVDRERQPDGEPVHAAPGASRLIPFDDEVPVILLDGEVDDAESIDRRPRDGAPERPEHPRRSERRKPRHRSDGDLHRVSGIDPRPRIVRHRRSAARLSPRALPGPAPLAGHRDRQLQLPPSCRLDCAHVPVVGAHDGQLRDERGT